MDWEERRVKAVALKDQGNVLFKQQKFQEAVEKYSEGIVFWVELTWSGGPQKGRD